DRAVAAFVPAESRHITAHLDAFGVQPFDREPHGVRCLIRQFRMLMQVPPPAYHVSLQPGHCVPYLIDHFPRISFTPATSMSTPNTLRTVSMGRASDQRLPK